MTKPRRKLFFIKGNFQIFFVTGFTLVLLLEVMAAGFFIYASSSAALEKAAFSSHLNLQESSSIITPIIFEVNFYTILGGIFLAGLAVFITCVRLNTLFNKIIAGLENLKNNNTSFRIKPSGGKNSRALISEFNHAASCLDKELKSLRQTAEALANEKDLARVKDLHAKLLRLLSPPLNYTPGV